MMMTCLPIFPSPSSAPARSALRPPRIWFERGIRPLIFERGESVGASLLEWAHVRVFSPWRYNIDAAARGLCSRRRMAGARCRCAAHRWRDRRALPATARCSAGDMPANLKLGATVTAITREGRDKVSSRQSRQARLRHPLCRQGRREHRLRARAVIDASGTWTQPNPMGVDGLAVPGEARGNGTHRLWHSRCRRRESRSDYAGKRILVIGGGHSAINVALALMELQQDDSAHRDFLGAAARTASTDCSAAASTTSCRNAVRLALRPKRRWTDGRLTMLAPFAARAHRTGGDGVRVSTRCSAKADSRLTSTVSS